MSEAPKTPKAPRPKTKPFPIYRNGALHRRRFMATDLEDAISRAQKEFKSEQGDHYFEVKNEQGRFIPVFSVARMKA